MIPYKIIVTTEDLAAMFDCSSAVAKNHLTRIREHFQKPKRSKVTAREVALYANIDPDEVLKALNREHWK